MNKITSKNKSTKQSSHKSLNLRSTEKNFLLQKKDLLFLLSLILLSFLTYYNSLSNDFIINWDDNVYLLKNNLIKYFTWNDIDKIFTTFYAGNYHPLTAITNIIEYKLFNLNPFPYHLNNLIIHLINTILVFIFIKKLTGRLLPALFCSAFFSIHPLRVESVVWISERKDVLYTFFLFLGLIYYLYHLEVKRIKFLIFTYISFIFSLLSKSAAVCFPLLLLIIDYYKNQKISIQDIIKKIPFFILSLIFGIIAIYSQKSSDSISVSVGEIYNFYERILLVTYSYFYYILHSFIPHNLSAVHYYPYKTNGLPLFYYLTLIITLLILLFWFYKKNPLKQEYRFGLMFYTAQIILVLQIIPVGQAIVAERYSYVSTIGIFFICGSLIEYVKKNKKIYHFLISATIVLILFFSYYTSERAKIWKNGYTLFSDVIEKYPEQSHPWWVRGNYFNETGQYELAIKNFKRAIEKGSNEPGLFLSHGYALHFSGKYKEAIENYNIAIKLKEKYPEAYYNRGTTYLKLDSLDKAIEDFTLAITYKPDYHEAWFNRAVCKFRMGKNLEAIEDYTKGINIFPYDAMAYLNRGSIYTNLKQYQKAIDDFNIALKIQPNNPEIYLNRAIAKDGLKDYEGALQDNNIVLKMQPQNPIAFFNRGIAKYYKNDKKGACEDWQNALKYGHPTAQIILNEYCK